MNGIFTITLFTRLTFMIHLKNKIYTVLLTTLLLISNAYSKSDNIVTTIKPLHSIVSNIVGDNQKVELIVTGSESPHETDLKPSQIKKIQNAKILFYINNDIETFISKAINASNKKINAVQLVNEANLNLLENMHKEEDDDDDHHDADHHEEEHGDHHHDGKYNLHVWLGISETIKMAKFIQMKLAQTYPENKSIYEKNTKKFIKKLNILSKKISMQLSGVKNKSFLTFHDGYAYFVNQYNLSSKGSITVNPLIPISAKKLKGIYSKIKRDKVICVFSEPQFPQRIVSKIATQSNIKKSILDPIGADLKIGKDLYFKLISKLSKNIYTCLS